MNHEVFFPYFIVLLGLAFAILSLWVVYDLDKDDDKSHIKKSKKF